MVIANILKIVRGLPQFIESFPINDEGLVPDIGEIAEEAFVSHIKEHEKSWTEKSTEEDINIYLENGCYDDHNGYEFHLIWSNVIE